MIRSFIKSTSGMSLIEYALLLGLLTVVALVILHGLGIRIDDVFTRIITALHSATISPHS